MSENVIPLRPTGQFGIFKGFIEETGNVVETDKVGVAYLKPQAKMYRMRLWMFTKEQYFLVQDDSCTEKYTVLSLDEYRTNSGETKTFWNKVGEGVLHGNFVRIRFHLLSEEIFLCLFRGQQEVEVKSAA